jgi:hypothetical protein
MPATPGTSAAKTLDPAIRLASSTTWDPFVGIEAGRTYTATPAETTRGGAGTDTIKGK